MWEGLGRFAALSSEAEWEEDEVSTGSLDSSNDGHAQRFGKHVDKPAKLSEKHFDKHAGRCVKPIEKPDVNLEKPSDKRAGHGEKPSDKQLFD